MRDSTRGATNLTVEGSVEIDGELWPLDMEPFFRVIGSGEAAHARLDLIRAHGALHGTVAADRASFSRDMTMAAAGLVDGVMILAITAGRLEGITSNGDLLARVGEICVLDMNETLTVEAFDCHAVVSLVPRSLMGAELRGGESHGRVLPADRAATTLLYHGLFCAVDHYRRHASSAAEDLTGPLAALAGACLRSLAGARRSGVDGAPLNPLVAIKRHIDANLFDPALSVPLLARQLGMARATLYRQFEPLGGIAHYIRSQRLHRARQELARDSAGPLRLAALAKRTGFKSEAQFSRAFRAAYGMSPREFRAGVPPLGASARRGG